MSIFRLAHLSDPHLPPPKGAFGWRDLASKRLLSRIAWHRKHREHQPNVLAALVDDIKTYDPDHIALTGDLTNFSSTVEVEAARIWLESLGPSDTVTVSPGNHDALVGSADPIRFSAWTPWLGDAPEPRFPGLRRRGDVAILNLCSALPTAPHLATGRLGEAQLAALDTLLADPAIQGAFRLVLIHHPPTRGAVSKRKALEDQAGLAEVLARRGADLVLHGHAHEALVGSLPGPDGTAIPVLGVPSASAGGGGRHPAARWHGIEIELGQDGAFGIRVIARGLDPETGRPVELGRYRLV
ncbi:MULTISPECIES: metallophosphoesterase family protein [unclassified Caulobacter]|uniref:metallophosphoesterase family protein n=1 Tax=unclassified Caulobacter TaxID=2648921 RepID=UPI000D35DDA9|nr:MULTISPECIES: metallophosphoesterase [unclassified Caulobacter]PTS88432.1 metallophosphoesterase [Caulobacter sp. HMWF009]PTT07372.1 metallophosphoesterase [Caulobacter sp. HMWF025]